MPLKDAKFALFMVIADEKYFFSYCIASFAVNLGSFDEKNLLNWWKI